jgi:H+/Cl- antiporter ClcA
MAWLLCIIGILFCIAGIYYFKKNAFEEGKRIRPSIFIMIMGVILIFIGTAKYFKLIN